MIVGHAAIAKARWLRQMGLFDVSTDNTDSTDTGRPNLRVIRAIRGSLLTTDNTDSTDTGRPNLRVIRAICGSLLTTDNTDNTDTGRPNLRVIRAIRAIRGSDSLKASNPHAPPRCLYPQAVRLPGDPRGSAGLLAQAEVF